MPLTQMERAGSPPVVRSTPALPSCAPPASVPPTPAPPTPRPSVSPVPVNVEVASHHASLLFEQGCATPTGALSSSPSLSFSTAANGTPPPESTSRLIQGLNNYELFETVHPQTLRAWDAVPGSKVVVFIANDTITKETHHRITLIRKALTTIFPDASPVIGSAALVSNFELSDVAHYRPVYPFLVHNLPGLYVRRLILEHCWTVDNFTFFALDFSPPTTSFVMTLAGLHLPAMPQSNDRVAQLVRRCLLESPSVALFIQNHHDNLPSSMTVNEQIESTIGTIDVSNAKLGEEDSPVAFNVYIHPLTNDPVQHRAWQRELRDIVYFADCGTGKAVPLFHCNVCKGRDHSSSSCPFPSNAAFQNASAQAEALPADNTGHGDRREAVYVTGINFNYFMRM